MKNLNCDGTIASVGQSAGQSAGLSDRWSLENNGWRALRRIAPAMAEAAVAHFQLLCEWQRRAEMRARMRSELARGGKAMFKDKTNPRFDEIRALFPIPSLTMHFVMSKNSGVSDFAGMEGKTILLGKGSFGAKEGAKYLKMFGLEGKVTLAEVELSNAVPALKNGQIDGFVTAGSFPAPNVIEAAASAGATVISLNEDQVKQSKRTRLVIPANTYAGQSDDIITTSLPVVAFTTTDMDNATAYALTKTYWENKGALGAAAQWWNGVSLDMLSNILTEIHPGAVSYYKQAGATLAQHH